MSEPVISVRNLGKRYRLGATLRHDTLRDHIVDAVKSGWNRLTQRPTSNVQRSTFNAQEPSDRSSVIGDPSSVTGNPSSGSTTPVTDHRSPITDHPPSPSTIHHSPSTIHASSASPSPSTLHPPPSTASSDEFWALRDVSFDVHQGEVVGIIGRNGAGKSTLLKILSQITEPTTGEVHIRGRVASLLEVGTGFHPELSGRENIYLNGAILGMRRAEIKSKFDEIVAFAEVEKFIDTPVKRYSSGMYVRLAFAVAAHLEPEILIVDEVLAVGDMEFQKKCLGKMGQVAQTGRTVLFVSHNMPAITRLCGRSVLLKKGSVAFDGASHEAVRHYLSSGSDCLTRAEWEPSRMPGDEYVRLRFVQLVDANDRPIDKVDITQEFGIQLGIEVLRTDKPLVPNIHIYTNDGVLAFVVGDASREERATLIRGPKISTVWVPGNLLNEGSYFPLVAVSTTNPVLIHFQEPNAIAIQVVENAETPSETRGKFGGKIPGVFRPLLRWTTRAG